MHKEGNFLCDELFFTSKDFFLNAPCMWHYETVAVKKEYKKCLLLDELNLDN